MKSPAKISYYGSIDCENSLLYKAKSKDGTLEKIKSQCKSGMWKVDTDSNGSIYKITRNAINSKEYVDYGKRVGKPQNRFNVERYCLEF